MTEAKTVFMEIHCGSAKRLKSTVFGQPYVEGDFVSVVETVETCFTEVCGGEGRIEGGLVDTYKMLRCC